MKVMNQVTNARIFDSDRQGENIKGQEQRETDPGMCREVTSGVYCLETGKGINRSNVYFVQSGASWVLIDTASVNCGQLIRKVAESLFGANTRPASILLTHVHPDHAGSALELAHMWDCRVYMHPDELPLAIIRDLSTVEKYANPLDHWMILPLLRLMPRQKVESMLVKTGLKDVAQGFVPGASLPNLPDWECIPTPGHTPGHVAFFRPNDRLLISGDAIVTVDLNSFWGFLMWGLQINKQRVSGPPWYSTWNWQMAKEAVTILAELEPRMLASGHGLPMSGDEIAQELHAFADYFSTPATKKHTRA
jgi:glyoxylase-like metal-dependent hydrolase (beta-lactamase superfamily II)